MFKGIIPESFLRVSWHRRRTFFKSGENFLEVREASPKFEGTLSNIRRTSAAAELPRKGIFRAISTKFGRNFLEVREQFSWNSRGTTLKFVKKSLKLRNFSEVQGDFPETWENFSGIGMEFPEVWWKLHWNLGLASLKFGRSFSEVRTTSPKVWEFLKVVELSWSSERATLNYGGNFLEVLRTLLFTKDRCTGIASRKVRRKVEEVEMGFRKLASQLLLDRLLILRAGQISRFLLKFI